MMEASCHRQVQRSVYGNYAEVPARKVRSAGALRNSSLWTTPTSTPLLPGSWANVNLSASLYGTPNQIGPLATRRRGRRKTSSRAERIRLARRKLR